MEWESQRVSIEPLSQHDRLRLAFHEEILHERCWANTLLGHLCGLAVHGDNLRSLFWSKVSDLEMKADVAEYQPQGLTLLGREEQCGNGNKLR